MLVCIDFGANGLHHGGESIYSAIASTETMKKHVPQALLKQITAVVPASIEVVPLDFRYEDEDYNIAVCVDEDVNRTCLQDRLYGIIFDYDDTHGTATLCYVWLKSDRAYIVAA
jgi:hypothetical protein